MSGPYRTLNESRGCTRTTRRASRAGTTCGGAQTHRPSSPQTRWSPRWPGAPAQPTRTSSRCGERRRPVRGLHNAGRRCVRHKRRHAVCRGAERRVRPRQCVDSAWVDSVASCLRGRGVQGEPVCWVRRAVRWLYSSCSIATTSVLNRSTVVVAFVRSTTTASQWSQLERARYRRGELLHVLEEPVLGLVVKALEQQLGLVHKEDEPRRELTARPVRDYGMEGSRRPSGTASR